VIYGFVKLTQVAPVYGFGEVCFLIKLDFFIVYFFIISLKKILEKNHIIKFYKVKTIKWCKETTVHSHTLHYEL